MILFLVSVLLVLLFSAFSSAILAPRRKSAYLLSFYLLSFAHLVLTGYTLNLFHALNRSGAYLAVQALWGLLAWLAWIRFEKPPLFGAFDLASMKALVRAARKEKILASLASGLTLVYAYSAYQNLRFPQNNMDSLSTHLARIAYWLQFGSFTPWPTPKLLQLVYPVNAQLLTYWTLLFLRQDFLVGFVQWSAALAAGIAVFGLARALGYSRRAAAYASLIFLGFPLVLLQSTTTQNDLVAAALFAATLFFFVLGIREKDRRALLLSALALGLGLGTKQTFYFLLPGIGILFLAAWFQRRESTSLLREWLIASLGAFLLFGAYMNGINLQYFGTPFGPPDLVDRSTGAFTPDAIAGELTYNIPRFVYQSFDTCGLPRPYKGYAHKIKARAAQFFLNAIHFDIEGSRYAAPGHEFRLSEVTINEESSAWYGPLSVLLLFPAMLYEGIRSFRRKEFLKTSLALLPTLFLLVDVVARPGWDPYQGRYFAPAFAAAAPLMSLWFEKRRPLFEGILTFLALTIALVTVLYNPAKPLLGKYADELDIWHRDRIFLSTIQQKNEYPMQKMVESQVPQDAVLGLISPSYCFEYLLFGEHFSRRVIPVYPERNAEDSVWLDSQGIEYLLIQESASISEPPQSFLLVSRVEGWALYRKISSP
jgi:4-amino-4-deoxy-L-arabinose transferase-like glycosyltransferase